MPRRRTERTIAVLAGTTALGAAGGLIYGLRGAPAVPAEWLEGSRFSDYRIPSVILGAGVGGTSAACAVSAWRGGPHTGSSAVAAGAVLTGWIVAQVAIIGWRSPLQPIMGGVGLALAALGTKLRRYDAADGHPTAMAS